MRRSGVESGGGIGMNKNVQPPVRTGSGSRGVRESGAASIGSAYGSHVTALGGSDSAFRSASRHPPHRCNLHC
jgi:hypothetical protein